MKIFYKILNQTVMKHNTVSTIVKNAFLVNIFVVSLFFATQVQASSYSFNNTKDELVDSTKTNNKLEVKYLGYTNEGLEFDVKFNNVKGSEFAFIIRDENGDVLYEKDFTNKIFTKKVQIPQVEDYKKLTFSIVSYKDKAILSKEITINSRYVEDLLVKIN